NAQLSALRRMADASHRTPAQPEFAVRLRHVPAGHVRIEKPRRDHVAGDPLATVLLRERGGQPEQPGFARAVVRLTRRSRRAQGRDEEEPPEAVRKERGEELTRDI